MDLSAARAARYGRAGARWARLLAMRRRPGVRVFYGHDRVPPPGERAAGGTVKMQKLNARFPNRPTDFSILYLGTTWLPQDLRPLLSFAKHRHVPVVANQDGVGYPGWAGDRTEEVNRPLRQVLRAAAHVLYQSEFSKQSSDLFLGEPTVSWEILPNAVDVDLFTPAQMRPANGPVLILGGDQTQSYRIELALRTLAVVRERHPDVRLLVTGRLVTAIEPLARSLGVSEHIQLVGEYAQHAWPNILRRGHLLLHTKVKDPCPTVVLEAMAAGLPVVHPASGGTVELVGDDAGVGVPHPESWEHDEPPSPEAMADAVERVLGDLDRFSAAARGRVVERFALEPWLDRHAALFARLAPK